MDDRIKWVDAAKGIAIFSVVFGHISKNPNAVAYVTSFHIPIFFFLSGFVFNLEKYPRLKQLLAARARTLLLPYLFFSIISYSIWILHGYSGAQRNFSVPLTQPILSFFYGNAQMYNGVLWFLPCLFSTQIMFYVVRKLVSKTQILTVILLASLGWGFLLRKIITSRLPWGIDVAFVAIAFYGFGHIVKENTRICRKMRQKHIIGIMALSLVFNVGFQVLNGRIGMDQAVYGNPFYFLVAALSGICFYSLLAKKLKSFSPLLFVGRNSMIIFALHIVLSVPITVKLSEWIIRLPRTEPLHSVPLAFLETIFAITILSPLVFLINRYLPFLAGKPRIRPGLPKEI